MPCYIIIDTTTMFTSTKVVVNWLSSMYLKLKLLTVTCETQCDSVSSEGS